MRLERASVSGITEAISQCISSVIAYSVLDAVSGAMERFGNVF